MLSANAYLVLVASFALVNQGLAWSSQRPAGLPTKCLQESPKQTNRRNFLEFLPQSLALASCALTQNIQPSFAEDAVLEPPLAALAGDAKKLFNDGRAFESNGNVAGARRLYDKVTKIEPRFIYGWSNLGNTQVALGDLAPAEESYSTAISLCRENLERTEKGFGIRRCDDLSILLLNRGSLRLNNRMQKEALDDLEASSVLRGKPDAVILQNLARAREVNGYYSLSDRDYTLAISMTANEVNPFWLRSALVKLQVGDIKDGFDLLQRVENRFPEAPEVKAAYATFLQAKGDQVAAQRKYLEIPDRQREKFTQKDYLKQVISWPPAAIDTVNRISAAVGDDKRF